MPERQEVLPDDLDVVGGLALLRCGRLQRKPPRRVPSIFIYLAEAQGTSCQAGVKSNSTSCLFLQRFVESEREFLRSLFLTNQSTFVLYGIPLLESLLVASSIFCNYFFSRVRAFYLSARVLHLRCSCHQGSSVASLL